MCDWIHDCTFIDKITPTENFCHPKRYLSTQIDSFRCIFLSVLRYFVSEPLWGHLRVSTWVARSTRGANKQPPDSFLMLKKKERDGITHSEWKKKGVFTNTFKNQLP